MGWLEDRQPYLDAHRSEFTEVLGEQAAVVLSMWQQLGQPLAVDDFYDRLRWDAALRDRLYLRNRLTAVDFGKATARDLGGELDPDELDGYLATSADLSAANINDTTSEQLQDAVLDEDDPDAAVTGVFDNLLGHRMDLLVAGSVALAANLGRATGAEQAGAATKTWHVNSRNPRSSHARMRGETVPVSELFSNGMRWPGDPAGGADQVANCRCSVEFS